MIEEIWTGLVRFTGQFVVPDWGALVGLIPLGLVALVALYIGITAFKWVTAGPTRRGPRKMAPVTSAGTPVRGLSPAPVLAAFGACTLVFGLVSGGPWLLAGILVQLVTLVPWVRETRHEMRHDGTPTTGVADNADTADTAASADKAAHAAAPNWRGATIATVVVILAGTLLLTSNNMPLIQVVPAASGGPAASVPSGVGGVPTPVPSVPAGDVHTTALNIAWTSATYEGPAGRAFTIVLNNLDPVPHNVELKDGSGATRFKGPLDNGPAVTVYAVDPLPAGQYLFVCSVHTAMTATLTLK